MGSGPYGGICPPWMQQQPAMWQFQPINLPPFGCPGPWAMNPGMARGPNACTGMRGGMMQRPVLMRRLRHLMKLMEEEKPAKSADENKAENQGEAEMTAESHKETEAAAAENSEGRPARGPHGRRHHIILRLQKMADAMSSSESGSSESETEINDQEPGVPPRLIEKIRCLVKSMEDGDSSSKDEKMDAGKHNTSDDNAEAGGATNTTDDGEDNYDADGDDKKQRRQMRRLVRMLGHGGRPGPCGMGGPRGMGMRGPAASAWIMPAFNGPPCMGMGPAAFGGLPPRFMRRMARCGTPARRMHRRQAREEMKKAKNADIEDVIGQSESDETPLNDWVELKKDINEME